MNTVLRYMTNNPCCKAGRRIAVRGLMLHSVGCAQPEPEVFLRQWDRADYRASCVHGIVGAEAAYITLPCMETAGEALRGWHAGGAANDTHLGIEMCEPEQLVYTGGAGFRCTDEAAARAFVGAATRNAAALFAALCALHGLDPLADGVIISHREGHARGIASNHSDPAHLWAGLGMDYDMDSFRRDVAAAMEGDAEMRYEQFCEFMARYRAELDKQPAPKWAEKELAEAVAAGITDGTKPMAPPQRYQAALMAYRAYQKASG